MNMPAEFSVRPAQPGDAAQVAALLVAAEEAAGELGCFTMEVTSRRSRTESHPFYRDLGYEDCCDRSACYLKDLGPGTSAVSHGTSFPRRPDPTAPG